MAIINGRIQRRGSRRNADINMTNLMDVMMVLLVVFMVAAPLMTSGIPLDLPKVGGGTLNGKDTSINISVDKDGHYYIGQSQIEPETIIDKIKAIKGENNGYHFRRYIFILRQCYRIDGYVKRCRIQQSWAEN